jgi:hypothetical protein
VLVLFRSCLAVKKPKPSLGFVSPHPMPPPSLDSTVTRSRCLLPPSHRSRRLLAASDPSPPLRSNSLPQIGLPPSNPPNPDMADDVGYSDGHGHNNTGQGFGTMLDIDHLHLRVQWELADWSMCRTRGQALGWRRSGTH